MNPGDHRPTDDTALLRDKLIRSRKVLERAVTYQWDLPPEQWDRFDGYLAAMDSALASADAEGITSAAAGIARLEPRRVTKLGSAGDKSPMPEAMHDRINMIVHKIDRLTAEPTHGAETPPRAAPDRG
jgi:CATRA-Associated Small Protein